MGELILVLLHSATNAHILHLQAKSFSEHSALGGFYEAMPELVDSLVEAIQGMTGEIIQYPADYYPPLENGLEELESLKEYFDSERRVQLPKDTEIQNIADEISQLIDSTLYKLRFLK